jgi:DNA-binding helix-hairpin-helix protein with protein kinase domain
LQVRTDAGHVLELGRPVGSGGEGVVCAVLGTQDLVAKILLRPAMPKEVENRLTALVLHGRWGDVTAPLLAREPRRAAWPVHTVHVLPDGERPVAGFLMPNMRRWYEPLSSLLSPSQRQLAFPGATWATALTATRNLASLVGDLHDLGYVIGDFKPGNLWVDAAANIGISDVDSFQFSKGCEMFPSRGRSEGYTAPECIDDPEALPGTSSDDFVLAVLIYQLLMDGMHPFYGTPSDGTRYVSLDDNIAHGRCRLVAPSSVRVLPGDPDTSALPKQLRTLLARCFGDAGRRGGAPRPTAREWADALAEASAPERLRTCSEQSRHVYSVERPWCPWCDISSTT